MAYQCTCTVTDERLQETTGPPLTSVPTPKRLPNVPNAWIAPRGVPQRLPTPQATQANPPKREPYSSQALGRCGEPAQPRLIHRTDQPSARCERMLRVP